MLLGLSTTLIESEYFVRGTIYTNYMWTKINFQTWRTKILSYINKVYIKDIFDQWLIKFFFYSLSTSKRKNTEYNAYSIRLLRLFLINLITKSIVLTSSLFSGRIISTSHVVNSKYTVYKMKDCVYNCEMETMTSFTRFLGIKIILKMRLKEISFLLVTNYIFKKLLRSIVVVSLNE